MELKDTIDLMLSPDFNDRFIAEYRQTEIRYNKLSRIVEKYIDGTLEFKPKCSLDLLKSQLSAMKDYLSCLKQRAKVEGIIITER